MLVLVADISFIYLSAETDGEGHCTDDPLIPAPAGLEDRKRALVRLYAIPPEVRAKCRSAGW